MMPICICTREAKIHTGRLSHKVHNGTRFIQGYYTRFICTNAVSAIQSVIYQRRDEDPYERTVAYLLVLIILIVVIVVVAVSVVVVVNVLVTFERLTFIFRVSRHALGNISNVAPCIDLLLSLRKC